MAFKLTPESLAEIIDAQRQLHDVLPEIDKAEQCGVDCQMYRQMHQEVGEKLSKMIELFGPNSR